MTYIKSTAVDLWSRLDESWRAALIAFLIVRALYTLWSCAILRIQPVVVQNFELWGEPILSIFKLDNSEAFVYRRDMAKHILTFQALNASQITDQQTGSIWDISTGAAVQGPYQDSVLAAAIVSPNDIFPYYGVKPYSGVWLAVWQRFDAIWYLSIAESGYGHIPGDVHFPPLYPLLLRALQPIFGSLFRAGIFLSNAATLIAMKLLYDLFFEWGGKKVAHRSLLMFVLYPTFFFCFSAYSEPVFLVAALLSLRAMKSRSWAWAGFWIFCAILIRLQGVTLLAPMLYLMWSDQPFLRKPDQWAGLCTAGVGGLLYLYVRAGSSIESTIPLVETELHARLVPPWQSYGYAVKTILAGNATFIDVLNGSVVTLAIVLLVWGRKKIPMEYSIYTALSLLVIMTRMVETQPLTSMSRYSLTFFPLFFILSNAGENPVLRRVILYSFIPLSLYLSAQFFTWGWVG